MPYLLFLKKRLNLKLSSAAKKGDALWINYQLASVCGLLITFANSLDPDQAGQNVQPDLDPNCLKI